MADKNIQMHPQVGGTIDETTNLYPKTKAALVDGLATVATSGSYNDLADKPDIPGGSSTIHKEYEGSFYGSANSWAGASWFFISVRPNTWAGSWTIKFRVRSIVNGQPTYNSCTDSIISGSKGTIAYHNWNIRSDAYAHYYISSLRLKEAGYTAGYSHAFGVSLYNASNGTSASYPRTFILDYYECNGCTVTILDTPVKYDGVPGYSTTNYETATGYNAVDNGLQETGDLNNLDRIYEIIYCYNGTISNKYCLVGRGKNSELEALSTTGITYSNSVYRSYDTPDTWVSGQAYTTSSTVFYAVNGGYYRCKKAHTSSSSIIPTNTTYWENSRYYNPVGFQWRCGLKWNTSQTHYAPGARMNGAQAYSVYPTYDFRYTDNCVASNVATNTLGLDPGKPVYIRGYIKDDLFYLYPKTVRYSNGYDYWTIWTQEEPTSAEFKDGYPVTYWYIGNARSGSTSYSIKDYALSLSANQEMFWYHMGKFRVFDGGVTGVYTGGTNVLSGGPIGFIGSGNITVEAHKNNGVIWVTIDDGTCLIEGTKIKMFDGTEKNIEDVVPGDSILSYDPNTESNVEAIVTANRKTGISDDYVNYYFDDGNFLTIYGKHCIYNVGSGTARGVDKWKIGWRALNEKNEITKFIGSEEIHHVGRKRHYDLHSSNKLYYANGILNAQNLTIDYATLKDRPMPASFLAAIKADYDSSANITAYKTDRVYGAKIIPVLKELKAAQEKMDTNKKLLADTDYIVTKFTEGLISMTEWVKSKAERAGWRKLVNEAEEAFADAKARYDVLRAETKADSTMKTRFDAAVARDNACLEDLREFYHPTIIENITPTTDQIGVESEQIIDTESDPEYVESGELPAIDNPEMEEEINGTDA